MNKTCAYVVHPIFVHLLNGIFNLIPNEWSELSSRPTDSKSAKEREREKRERERERANSQSIW